MSKKSWYEMTLEDSSDDEDSSEVAAPAVAAPAVAAPAVAAPAGNNMGSQGESKIERTDLFESKEGLNMGSSEESEKEYSAAELREIFGKKKKRENKTKAAKAAPKKAKPTTSALQKMLNEQEGRPTGAASSKSRTQRSAARRYRSSVHRDHAIAVLRDPHGPGLNVTRGSGHSFITVNSNNFANAFGNANDIHFHVYRNGAGIRFRFRDGSELQYNDRDGGGNNHAVLRASINAAVQPRGGTANPRDLRTLASSARFRNTQVGRAINAMSIHELYRFLERLSAAVITAANADPTGKRGGRKTRKRKRKSGKKKTRKNKKKRKTRRKRKYRKKRTKRRR